LISAFILSIPDADMGACARSGGTANDKVRNTRINLFIICRSLSLNYPHKNSHNS
jgi:hypothetical protein